MSTVVADDLLSSNDFTTPALEPTGITIVAPPMRFTNEFEAEATMPDSANLQWRALLCTSAGGVLAQLADVEFGDIVETHNDIGTADLFVPFYDAAGNVTHAAQLIDAADVLPEIEVQIWRGDELAMWGPITDATPEANGFRLNVSDAAWWLSRRFFGGLGQDFQRSAVVDPAESNLSGWGIFHTTAIGSIPTFAPVDPNVFSVSTEHTMPNGNPMLKAVTPFVDPNDAYQIYKDIPVALSGTRPLKLRLTAWLYLDQEVFETNQNFGLLLTWLPEDSEADLPGGYFFANLDWGFSGLDDISTGHFIPLVAELEIPTTLEDVPVFGAIIHVAWCPPGGTSFLGGLTLRGDDGLFYVGQEPTLIAEQAIEHAQDPDFLKDDRNISAHRVAGNDKTDRDFVFEDHAPILGAAIQGLASDGWFDWHTLYSFETRYIGMWAGRRGKLKPFAVCRLNAAGVGNVADIRRNRSWSSGATLTACQDRSTETGKHERATQLVGAAAIEDISVGSRDARDYDLAPRSAERLALLSHPDSIEIESLPGDRRLISGIALGDTIPVLCTKPGHAIDGNCRVVRRTFHPKLDTVTVLVNVAVEP